MKNLGAVFQRLMDNMFGNIQPPCAFMYINNINIFGLSLIQYLTDLGDVFELSHLNLNIGLKKLSFVKPKK